MATFYIQTDKEFYFAGDTVSGNVFVNVGAMIMGAQGISLKFSGYECVKWVESQELHRPAPNPPPQPGQPPRPPPYDPIAAIPPHQLVNSDVLRVEDRIWEYLTASLNKIKTLIFVLSSSVLHRIGITEWHITKQGICSAEKKP